MVEIEMPQGADVRGFVAADLTCRAPFSATISPGRPLGRSLGLPRRAVGLHEVLDRGIGGESPQ